MILRMRCSCFLQWKRYKLCLFGFYRFFLFHVQSTMPRARPLTGLQGHAIRYDLDALDEDAHVPVNSTSFVGTMTYPCVHCGALKFHAELHTNSCCLNGHLAALPVLSWALWLAAHTTSPSLPCSISLTTTRPLVRELDWIFSRGLPAHLGMLLGLSISSRFWNK